MVNTLYSLLILLFFSTSGYGFHVLLGNHGKDFLTRFVLCAWSGLLLYVVVGTNLYYLTGNIFVSQFAIPLVAIFSSTSLLFFIKNKHKKNKINADWFSLAVLSIAFLTMLLMSTPFLNEIELTFFYSNNGEYTNYALFSDIVQNKVPGALQIYKPMDLTQSIFSANLRPRESILGILVAVFSTLFNKSTFFLVQPFSYAISLLFFLTFGALLVWMRANVPKSLWFDIVAIVGYAAAFFSSAGLQFWTSSFMSHYINQVFLLGLILFLLHAEIKQSNFSIQTIVAIAMTLTAVGCGYPDFFIPTSAFILFYYYVISKDFSFHVLFQKTVIIFSALILVLILGNTILYDIISQYLVLLLKNIGLPGWDIYGNKNQLSTVFGNLLGLSNVFCGNRIPSTSALYSAFILLSIGVVKSIFVYQKERSLRFLSLLLYWHILSCIAIFTMVEYKNMPSNYVAVKLAISGIWILYLTNIYFLGTLKPILARGVVVVCGIIVCISLIGSSISFSRNLYVDTRQSYFTESNAAFLREEIDPIKTRIISAPQLHNFNIIGTFLILNKDLYPQIIENKYLYPIDEQTINDDSIVLVLGPGHADWDSSTLLKKHHATYRSASLSLYKPR